jgi:hypothetical protein
VDVKIMPRTYTEAKGKIKGGGPERSDQGASYDRAARFARPTCALPHLSRRLDQLWPRA